MHVTWLPPPPHTLDSSAVCKTLDRLRRGSRRLIACNNCIAAVQQGEMQTRAGEDNLEYLPIKQEKYILSSIGGKCKQNIIMQVAGGNIVAIFAPAAAVRCGCGGVVGTVCRARVLMTISYISHCSRISEYNYTCGHNRFYNPCGIEVSKKFRKFRTCAYNKCLLSV